MDVSAVGGILSTGLASISSSVMGFAVIALPIGLGIVGLFLGVRLAIKFFKGVSKA